MNKFELTFCIITVHFAEGLYVVGAGRNGIKFSFILIVVFFSIIVENKEGWFVVGGERNGN